MNVTVKGWMSGNPVSINPDASAIEALDLMVEFGIRHLPVVGIEETIVGVLSIDDLHAVLGPGWSLSAPPKGDTRDAARDWRVGEVMTWGPITTQSGTPLLEAVELLTQRRIGCLPVVDDADRLVGILSETDALNALAAALASETIPERKPQLSNVESLVSDLKNERSRIAARLERLETSEVPRTGESRREPLDSGERGAALNELRLSEGLDAMARRRLQGIDRALERAAEGTLSLCRSCGAHIPIPRLRALPGTTLCVTCAREREHDEWRGIESEAHLERSGA